jgi:hypothetical protein
LLAVEQTLDGGGRGVRRWKEREGRRAHEVKSSVANEFLRAGERIKHAIDVLLEGELLQMSRMAKARAKEEGT